MLSTKAVCDHTFLNPYTETNRDIQLERIEHNRNRLKIYPTEFSTFSKKRSCNGAIQYVQLLKNQDDLNNAIATNGEGRILVVDNFMRSDCTAFDARQFRAANASGWAGVIVLGAIRDSGFICRYPMRNLSLRGVMTHPHKWFPLETDELQKWKDAFPFNLDYNDWIVADDDGVVLVQKSLLKSLNLV